MLREYFGKELNKQLNPDEAVAEGAAIQAGMLASAQAVASDGSEQVEFQNVTPLHVGIRVCGLNPDDPGDDRMDVVIPKNTPYPCQKSVKK